MPHDQHAQATHEHAQPGAWPALPPPTEESVIGHRSPAAQRRLDQAEERPDVLGGVALSMLIYGLLTALAGVLLMWLGMSGLPFAAPTGMVAMGVGQLVAAVGLVTLLVVRAVQACVAWLGPPR